MTADPVVQKYLERNAEHVARDLPALGCRAFDAAVVIPAYDEDADALSGVLGGVRGGGRDLVVFVVNAPQAVPASAQLRNAALLDAVRRRGAARQLTSAVTLIAPEESSAAVLLVDATGGDLSLEKKEGVGRARKIGLDIALALYARGDLRQPFAGSTDADVVLPVDYFSALATQAHGLSAPGLPPFSAVLFPYRHVLPSDPVVASAMRRVEMSFRYYVLGLARAGSPYAYHSLGSALAVSLPHYARVRGVPNRQAGEDFYLLSKLSKLAPLRRLAAPVVEIATRVSDRVPFGTGPSLHNVLSSDGDELLGDHPEAFEYLKIFLDALVEAGVSGEAPRLWAAAPEWVSNLADEVYQAACPHLQACPTAAHRVRRLHERFDALSTRQFIHRAHREGLVRLPIRQAVALVGYGSEDCDESAVLDSLAEQEAELPEAVGLIPA